MLPSIMHIGRLTLSQLGQARVGAPHEVAVAGLFGMKRLPLVAPVLGQRSANLFFGQVWST